MKNIRRFLLKYKQKYSKMKQEVKNEIYQHK